MRVGHRTALLGLLAALAGPLPCASPAAAEPAHLPGLNPAEVAARADCGAPPPGYARCAAEQLVYRATGTAVRAPAEGQPAPAASAGRAAGGEPAFTPAGYGPSELQSAYALGGLSAAQGASRTIALVDAYDDPNAESDLAVYRSRYGLPACTTANGCFSKLEQTGIEPSPPKEDWAVEVSLDLDMASAICPNCKIMLVEAATPLLSDLGAAESTAATAPGVVAISNSYGLTEEYAGSQTWSNEEAAQYNHPGVAITASAGDDGYEVEFPAVLSSVTAVGGTSLTKSGAGWSQTAWSGTGAGCSTLVAKPPWQRSLGAADAGCSMRTNNDVSAVANPSTGVAVYDTYNSAGGWNVVGGTSAASPIVAAFYALIGHGAGAGGAAWDYAHTSFFTDVSGGFDQNGCASYLCEAIVGYDGPTGLGTPYGASGASVGGEEGSQPVNGGTGLANGGGTPGTQPASPAPSDPPVSVDPPAPVPQVALLSALSLTPNALATLNRPRTMVFDVAFTFRLSSPARVLVTLAERIKTHARTAWKTLPYSLTLSARKGRTSAHLRAHHALSPGTYRLTLTPAHGSARSLLLRVS